jgi:hypothetical protein
MNSTTRLNDAQARLEQAGYVDLKFFFSFGQEAKSDVQDGLASMLEKFSNGEHTASSFDDKHLLPA